MNVKKVISLEDAYLKLLEDFPEQENQVLVNKGRFKNAIKILRIFYQHDDISGNLTCGDLFCGDENFITNTAYDYFSKRIEEFSSILHDVREDNKSFPLSKNLVPITDICPEKIQLKKYPDRDNKLILFELIDLMGELYIRLGSDTNMAINSYCWLLGSFYTYERSCKRKMMLNEDDVFGYKCEVDASVTNNNLKLYKIDKTCLEYADNGIIVKRVYINNREDLSMDCIDGGVLTGVQFRSDFYYYLTEPKIINFNNIYVVEDDALLVLNSMEKSSSKYFKELTKNQQRVEIIKYALENNLLPVDVKSDEIPTFKHRKVDLFELLRLNDDVSTKYNKENRSLFSVNVNEFFKTCKEVKLLIRFRSGRPRKEE